jgi:hypothetical protein
MLNLLSRTVETVNSRLVLLSPSNASMPSTFENVDYMPLRHAQLMVDMQRLRGSIYLKDGAVERHQLTIDGRHQTPEDEKSWHLLMVDKRGHVDACVWYMAHNPNVSVDRLRVRHCPLLENAVWRRTLVGAVESELARAKQAGMGYAEVGGWAVAEQSRCTSEGLILALAGYSLGRLLGGALGITTATVRHCSSTILRRLGGTDLQIAGRTVPSYYDPQYKCQMELLRFDSRQPSSKYNALVEMLKRKLTEVLVVSPAERAHSQNGYDGFRQAAGFQQSVAAAG